MKSLHKFVHSPFFLQKKRKQHDEDKKQAPSPNSVFKWQHSTSRRKSTYLCLDLRLPLLQEFGHGHGPVLAGPFAAHSPFTQQRHHSFIIGGNLMTRRNGCQPCQVQHSPNETWGARNRSVSKAWSCLLCFITVISENVPKPFVIEI